MVATTPSTIILKGDTLRKERDAAGAITPGHLVTLNTTNGVVVHATAGGTAARWIAVENDIAGDGIDHAYASTEVVQIAACPTGTEVYGYLKDGENAVIGSFLESAGDGSFKVADVTQNTTTTETAGSVIAMALEAVNLTATANVTNARMKVEML